MSTILGPLGLLPEISKSISAELIAKLKYIEEYDLEIQKKIYVAKGRCPSVEANTLERELKRFLSLTLLEPQPKYESFVPSEVVDGLWHRFILHTKDYREFCEKTAGHFIDHNPEKQGRGAGLAKYSGELFGYTKELLTKYYGHLPPFVWGLSAKCDHGAPCITFG